MRKEHLPKNNLKKFISTQSLLLLLEDNILWRFLILFLAQVECSINICEHICYVDILDPGVEKCACRAGYTLGDDQKSCIGLFTVIVWSVQNKLIFGRIYCFLLATKKILTEYSVSVFKFVIKTDNYGTLIVLLVAWQIRKWNVTVVLSSNIFISSKLLSGGPNYLDH